MLSGMARERRLRKRRSEMWRHGVCVCGEGVCSVCGRKRQQKKKAGMRVRVMRRKELKATEVLMQLQQRVIYQRVNEARVRETQDRV